MSRSLLLLLSLLVLLSLFSQSVRAESVELDLEDNENDNEAAAMDMFPQQLADHEQSEEETDAALRDEDMALLEVEEMDSEAVDNEAEDEVEVDAEDEAEVDVDAEAEESDAAAASEALEDDIVALELGVADDGEQPEHPTYVLPYPPVLPGHYTPLFNPYTNVNPLSTPFANYAATPGAHPGVAAAAAAQAGSLAAVNGQIAGAAGGYPYYPFAGRNPVIAAQLTGNPVPFSGYAGWIHPQNLNSAGVGENEDAEFPQFVEVATEEAEDVGCVGCQYN